MAKNPEHRDLFPGALEIMILQSLRLKPMHGYALVKHIKQVSDNLLQVEEGSLYPALQRMLREGWLESETGVRQRASHADLSPDGCGRAASGSGSRQLRKDVCRNHARAGGSEGIGGHRCRYSISYLLALRPAPPLRRSLRLDPGAHRRADRRTDGGGNVAQSWPSKRRGASSATWR